MGKGLVEFAKAGLRRLGLDESTGLDFLQSRLEQEDIAPRAKEMLTPPSPGTLVVWEQLLTYSVAKAMRGSGKITIPDVEAARAMVSLKDLKTPTQVRERLLTLKLFQESKIRQLERELEVGLTGSTGKPRLSPTVSGQSISTEGAVPATAAPATKRFRFNPETGNLDPVQ